MPFIHIFFACDSGADSGGFSRGAAESLMEEKMNPETL